MKIVITGALGHIGSELIRQLPISFPNSQIVMIDNLTTQRFSSLYNLPEYGKYRFIESDVTKASLDDALSGAEYVIHLAAITDAASSFQNAKFVEENNLTGTMRVAEACLKMGSKLISLSSTSVYGTQERMVDENCALENLMPQSPYAETKLKEESLLREFSHSGLKYACLRFGTIYGSSIGMRFHTAVNKFCWQAVMKMPITVWETAYEQKRPYLDLTDAVKAIQHFMMQNKYNCQTYNVLTENLTVKDVINTIKKYVPNLEINFVKHKIMNQLSYEVSTEKIKETGFVYVGNIDSGVKNTISILKNSQEN